MTQADRKYLGETVEVKELHRFDPGRLEAFLHDCLPGFQGPLSIRQFESGQSNLTYLVTTPQRAYVMRRKPPGKLLKSAHAVDREFLVMRKLREIGFPVPEVHVLCTDDSIVGTMFYVMSHVPGRIFMDCSMPDLTRAERAAVFDSVNEVLARLHTVDYAALGLESFGRPGNYFSRQIARWSQQYQLSACGKIEEMDQLMAWLPTAVPDDPAACLIHGDFSFHNVLIHPTQPHVVAVIDWELSTIGHPLGDLMYHMMEWYRPPGSDLRGTLRDRDLASLGIPSFDDYLHRYCERAGVAMPENIALYRAYNLFRIAAIAQGVAGRVRDGIVVSESSKQMAANVRPLAQAAWLEARKAGADR